MISKSIFTVGGTVQADQSLYITRQADDELLSLCQAGTFVYVLSPRQLGKSSLMMRTSQRLAEENVKSVIIDLTQLGTQVTAEAWYLGLLAIIEDQLMLDTGVLNWWKAHAELGITQRLTQFFEEVLLKETTTSVVIFVDEIDTTLSLSFTDDFYTSIRYFYQARMRQPEFKRLSFVLLGVATPGDLIQDPRRTPFNIGQRLDMTDFTLEEALPLADGLNLPPEEARQILKWVLKWTGGHPYLTQRLCRVITEQKGEISWTEPKINELVRNTFLGENSEQDNNLQFVRDMLTRRSVNPLEVLETYREIRNERRPVIDQEQSLVKSHLKLSGVVKRDGKALKVRNRIYRNVFDEKWIQEHLPINWAKRLRQAAGLIAASLLLTLLMSGLAVYAFVQQGEAENSRATAQSEANRAITAQVNAEQQRQRAEEQSRLALSAFSNQLVAQSRLYQDKQPDISLLLGIEATHIITNSEAQANLFSKTYYENPEINTLLKGHTGIVASVAFSPDGKTFASGSYDNTIILWDSVTGKQLQQLKGHDSYVASVAFSLDGQTLASGGWDKTIILWDTATGKQLQQLKGHTSYINSVAFSPDGKALASGSLDKTIILWDTATGKQINQLTYTSGVNSVAFSPDGKTLASGGDDKTIILWDTTTGKPLNQLKGHTDYVRSVAFSPDGKTLVSGGDDNTIIVWDAASGKQLNQLKWHAQGVQSVAFSPDGKTLASGSNDGSIILWNISTEKQLNQLKDHTDSVVLVAFSPDGKTLAAGSFDKTIILWDTTTWKQINQLKGHTDWVIGVTFSPDGKILATGSVDKTIILWDSATGKQLNQLKGHTEGVARVAFSPDGKTLASASADSTIILWDVTTGKQFNQFKGHTASVIGVAFSPDGKTLASGSFDNTIILWDSATGKQLNQLKGHTDSVILVAFSPDGKTLASASNDKTIILWDATTGKQFNQLKGHTGIVASVAFSPDGKTLASGSQDKTVILWDLRPESLLARACQKVNRNFTQAEWAQFLGNTPYRKTCPDLP